MTTEHPIDRYLARYPAIAVLAYVALLAVFTFTIWVSVADMLDRR